jgi:hypothetical protein
MRLKLGFGLCEIWLKNSKYYTLFL